MGSAVMNETDYFSSGVIMKWMNDTKILYEVKYHNWYHKQPFIKPAAALQIKSYNGIMKSITVNST